MSWQLSTKLACALFFGTLIAAFSPVTGANADTCTEISGGTCKSHGTCDTSDTKKHCLDTLKKDGYHCECRRGKNDRPHDGHGPDINFGISLGIGHHGWIGLDVGTGGYCDRWGCPGDYWDYPVFYGPIYFDGEWYEGPIYYREYHGYYEYYVHGGWHEDEWRGERPDWVGDTHYGPALGMDYYKSDDFKHWHERHGRDEHDGRGHDEHGDRWKDGDGKKHKDRDRDDHKEKGHKDKDH